LATFTPFMEIFKILIVCPNQMFWYLIEFGKFGTFFVKPFLWLLKLDMYITNKIWHKIFKIKIINKVLKSHSKRNQTLLAMLGWFFEKKHFLLTSSPTIINWWSQRFLKIFPHVPIFFFNFSPFESKTKISLFHKNHQKMTSVLQIQWTYLATSIAGRLRVS